MNKLKKWGIAVFSLAVIAILTAIGGTYYYNTEVNGYPDTKNFSDKIDQLDNKSKQKTVLIFHKPGCPDCKKARNTIKKTIKTHQKTIDYVVINVKKSDAQAYLAKYGVTQVPTVIALKGNQVIDSTSSNNNETIAKVVAGD